MLAILIKGFWNIYISRICFIIDYKNYVLWVDILDEIYTYRY